MGVLLEVVGGGGGVRGGSRVKSTKLSPNKLHVSDLFITWPLEDSG